ncbi:UNVERIFIED_CONTAM: Ribonuclease 3-like protein 3 [Sesamum radiatum]|uniref:Ribonuclease 3-like protein 3 n=1 Tax=Sesamum radiatum TaxID=300843 RepID=A0AAW2LL51_SESRA
MKLETKSIQSLEEVEKIIGYRFNDRNLLCQAFTHPSYQRDCVSYERLEYVGDSVLNLLITKEQFSMYPELPPGLLTPLRAANVDTEKLARVAIQHNFHRYIRLGNPILIRQIQAFIDALPKHPLHSHGLINAPKVLADVVESTVGAVFVDSNYSIDTTWEVVSDVLKPIITPEMLQKNPVKKLFEICQKYKLKLKLVDLWSQEGTYKVFINNKLRGKGMCREKKEIALNRAANDAYKEVVRRMSEKNFSEGCL